MATTNHQIPNKTIQKLSSNPKNLDKVHQYLRDSIEKMKVKQEKLMEKHNFGDTNNKFVLYPERNAFYMFNSKTNKVFFKAKFQIIGTYSEKSRTWRWGWSNRYVPYDLKKTSLKIKKFGEANKIDLLSQPKIKDDNMGHVFTALGMSLSNSSGYYIIPGTRVYPFIFIIFTQIEKVNMDYSEVMKKMRNNSRMNSQAFRDKLKLDQPTVRKSNIQKSSKKSIKKDITKQTKSNICKVTKKPKKAIKSDKSQVTKKPKKAIKSDKSQVTKKPKKAIKSDKSQVTKKPKKSIKSDKSKVTKKPKKSIKSDKSQVTKKSKKTKSDKSQVKVKPKKSKSDKNQVAKKPKKAVKRTGTKKTNPVTKKKKTTKILVPMRTVFRKKQKSIKNLSLKAKKVIKKLEVFKEDSGISSPFKSVSISKSKKKSLSNKSSPRSDSGLISDFIDSSSTFYKKSLS